MTSEAPFAIRYHVVHSRLVIVAARFEFRAEVRMRRFMFLLLPLLTSAGIAGCSTSTASPPASTATTAPLPASGTGSAFSAVLVTDVGGLHDASFNQEAWSGLRQAHSAKGIRVSAEESHTESRYLPDLERAARGHATVTIAVGYSMSRAVYAAAEAYPRSRFVLVDARPVDGSGHETSLSNVENLLFREQESGYVAGVVAGKFELAHVAGVHHNTIGYLAGPSIPQVEHYIAGFLAGVHATDPAARILSQTTASFTNPAAGMSAADAQVAAGADVTFQVAGQTGTAYLQRAQQRGAYAIGVDSDMRYLGRRVLTSAVKKVNVALAHAIKRIEAGHFHGGDVRVGASQGATGIAPIAIVAPRVVRAAAKIALQRIASGQLTPPIAPPAR